MKPGHDPARPERIKTELNHLTATSLRTPTQEYRDFVNPQWVRLFELLQMKTACSYWEGCELHTTDGRIILDFLSGYCAHNAGHNHPYIVEELSEELPRRGPAMLQSHVPDLAGELARRLCNLAGGRLSKVFFACSGSEGVESAIKFSRAATGRRGLPYASGAFHGLTCGALSLMGNDFWRGKFGPMLSDTVEIPFNDLAVLKGRLKTKEYAAFIVEPIQSEAGIRLPDADYLRQAGRVCAEYGTLFVLDKVQTGMFRTGRFLAGQHYGADPDIVIMAKALPGGLVPAARY